MLVIERIESIEIERLYFSSTKENVCQLLSQRLKIIIREEAIPKEIKLFSGKS
jgi:hypothetical protein